jgi:geranylgeranyl pyrophosphate synthase
MSNYTLDKNTPIEIALKQVSMMIRRNMENVINILDAKESVISEAMMYMLLGDGKMLRPFLLYATNSAFSSNTEKIIDAATAIEMIHVYTLTHDDLPAIDNDDYRRGQPSCHKKYSEAIAILVGDALLTLAFQILAKPNIEVPAELQLNLINEMASFIGYKGMVGGQALDVISKDKKLDTAQAKKIKILKTSNLFIATCRHAALINNANAKEVDALGNYSKFLGLAYQIKDDIEDEEKDGSEKCLHDMINESLNCLNVFGNKFVILKNFTKFYFKTK